MSGIGSGIDGRHVIGVGGQVCVLRFFDVCVLDLEKAIRSFLNEKKMRVVVEKLVHVSVGGSEGFMMVYLDVRTPYVYDVKFFISRVTSASVSVSAYLSEWLLEQSPLTEIVSVDVISGKWYVVLWRTLESDN